jgi:hypothetical protein
LKNGSEQKKKNWEEEVPVRARLRGKKEEKKSNGGERGGSVQKGEKERWGGGGGGLVGTVEEMKGGYVLKYNWFGGICGEKKRILG